MAQKIIPIIFSILLLGFVILYTEPPKSWVEATVFQWSIFYLPLLLLLTALSNLYFKFWIKSIVVGLGLTILVILFGLKALNLASTVLTIAATILIVRSLKKPDRFRRILKAHRLTKLRRQ